MQFIRGRIAAPRPSESRSVALWKQLGWFSASKTYATSQQPNCASAVEAKVGYSQRETRLKLRRPAPLDLLNGREIVRHTDHLLRPIAVNGSRIDARGTEFCRLSDVPRLTYRQTIANRIASPCARRQPRRLSADDLRCGLGDT
jgi:hypothetical protein